MYYLVYDKTGAVIGCTNLRDNSKNLLEISKMQYIDFIEGKSNFLNYQVQLTDSKPILQLRKVEKQSAVYKSSNLKEIIYDSNAEILVRVANNGIILFAKETDAKDGIINLYITKKDNPLRFIGIVEVDLAKLKTNQSKKIEIPSIAGQQISIYTTNSTIKFGLNNE